jgi:hypothetical protein
MAATSTTRTARTATLRRRATATSFGLLAGAFTMVLVSTQRTTHSPIAISATPAATSGTVLQSAAATENTTEEGDEDEVVTVTTNGTTQPNETTQSATGQTATRSHATTRQS